MKKEIEVALSGLKTEADCQAFHVAWLGKDGRITAAVQGLRNLPHEERAKAGQELNILKRETEASFFKRQEGIKQAAADAKLMNDKLVDITIPPIGEVKGSLHPITRVMREVEEAFASMGFIIEDGNEIATEDENFTFLNIPHSHPARDIQDTFWLSNGNVLRTHTTAMQNGLLQKYGPECRVLFPGRCYRNENLDASHDMAFFQVDGIMVNKDISIANLIYFMKTALSAVFKKDIAVRLRPGFFPFTEPSFELDASCAFCEAKGCSTCKQSGWIEFCGCGMIHPNVLRMANIDPEVYQGFAFGFGLTRLAMLKFGVSDIRVFNSGDVEKLKAVG
ncbi:MAG: phenylalanine--tRNA ligase subunit alpha [Firmicutes bacterium]|nr:phenylalanine--tRNA ligase subunit alpha [Bacillota bacterium]